MFKETMDRGQGESQPKSELETKIEQLMLMRRKKAELEQKRSIPMSPSEGEKLNQEYEEVSSLIEDIELSIDTLKAAEQKRLEAKFERTAANDEDAFDNALKQTGEYQEADRLDARRKAA